jgi:hypothetical protein
MNKKGLILIFLFVVSTIGVVALTNAKPSEKMVNVTIEYAPSAYVPQGEVWVEIDTRFTDNSMVFGQEEIIHFGFHYDVAALTFGGGPYYGDGFQCTNWVFSGPNNITQMRIDLDAEGKFYNETTGKDNYVYLFDETRWGGQLNIMLDDWNLGKGNVDLGDDVSSYQELYKQKNIPMEVGWHTLTVFAAELVSDVNHTTWHYEYAKDSHTFWVGTDKNDFPEVLFPIRAPYNKVNVEETAVASQDLPLMGYTITDWADQPRPIAQADPTGLVYQEMDVGTEAAPLSKTVKAIWNSSMSNPYLDTNYSVEYYNFHYASDWWGDILLEDVYHMVPSHYYWQVNDLAIDEGETEFPLNEGINYVYFIVIGPKIDDLALYYMDAYGASIEDFTVPLMDIDLAIFRIQVGPVAATGISFGIFISVSMLGLVTALYLMRRKR